MTITTTANGRTLEHPDAWAAVRSLLPLLPTDRLGAALWLDLLRQVKRGRTPGLPEVAAEPGSAAVPERGLL